MINKTTKVWDVSASTLSEGSNVWINPSSDYAVLATAATVNRYTLTYDANAPHGEVAGMPNPRSISLSLGGLVQISSVKPTRTGFNFKEWNTSRDATGLSYQQETFFYYHAITSYTLYAIWYPETFYIYVNDVKINNSMIKDGKVYGSLIDLIAAIGGVHVEAKDGPNKSTSYNATAHNGNPQYIKFVRPMTGDEGPVYFSYNDGSNDNHIATLNSIKVDRYGGSQWNNNDILVDIDNFCALVSQYGFEAKKDVYPYEKRGGTVVNGHVYVYPVPGETPASSYGPSHWIKTETYEGYRDAVDLGFWMAENMADAVVVAIVKGVLSQVRNNNPKEGYANRADIILKGDDGIKYYYTHLRVNSPASFGFVDGIEYSVVAGQPIGMIGNRGESDGADPHLHISATPIGSSYPTDKHIGDWLRTLLPQLK